MLTYLIFLALIVHSSLENVCTMLGGGVGSSKSLLIYNWIKTLEFTTKNVGLPLSSSSVPLKQQGLPSNDLNGDGHRTKKRSVGENIC